MFAQESVMDIKKEREAFERLPLAELAIESEFVFYNEETNSYWPNEDFCPSDAPEAMNFAWEAWQAATAQAVPNAQQALHDRLLVKSIREHVESHISEISVNDLFDKGWLAAMKCIQNNIDMLELQDPAND